MGIDEVNGRHAAVASGRYNGSVRRWVLGASLVLGAVSAQAALQARDLDGDTVTDAYYDTVLNITWLRDWNAGAGSSFDNGLSTTDGRMTWANANAWAQNLSFGGYTDWRLPTLTPVNGTGFQTSLSNNGSTDLGYAKTGTGWGTASEMGHLYYVTLANEGLCTPNDASPASCSLQPGFNATPDSAPFVNMQSDVYWSGLEYLSSTSGAAWHFYTVHGSQGANSKNGEVYAVAVRPGDVAAAIPEPHALALALLALGAAGVVRRQRPA